MPKSQPEFNEQIVVRITTQQRTFVDDLASLHDVKPSVIVRGLIEAARLAEETNAQVDKAIAVLDAVLGPIKEATNA